MKHLTRQPLTLLVWPIHALPTYFFIGQDTLLQFVTQSCYSYKMSTRSNIKFILLQV